MLNSGIYLQETDLEGCVDRRGVVGIGCQLGMHRLGEKSQIHVHFRPDLEGTLQQLQRMAQDQLQTAPRTSNLSSSAPCQT
jgi:hypothetical protein